MGSREDGGTATGEGSDTLRSVENLTGSDLPATLTGNTGADYLQDLRGNDAMDGDLGTGICNGGSGRVTLKQTAGEQ